MPELLYLDTARLGRMSPRASRASVDFARFAGEYGATLYLTDFLRDGFQALPSRIGNAYSGLADWSGTGSMVASLRRIAAASPKSHVVVASRAASLMKVAARLLVRLCSNILVTDLSWPTYDHILRKAASHRGYRITTVPVRRRVLREAIDAPTLVDIIAQEFDRRHCDGLFLPLVDNFGVRVPVREIVSRIEGESELRFVAVDAAQAINHVPLDIQTDYCDFLIAGCHKWLQAFTPMGLGYFGHPRSADSINDAVTRWTQQGILDDPLLNFAEELQSGRANPVGETVCVSPLVCANGAVVDALEQQHKLDTVVENGRVICEIAEKSRWRCVTPHEDLASRIVLLQSNRSLDRSATPDQIRRRFLRHDIALSAYDNALIRISLPDHPLSEQNRCSLSSAFNARD